MSGRNKSNHSENENFYPNKDISKNRNKNKIPLGTRSSNSRSVVSSNTPNFGKISPPPSQKSISSKQSLEYIFEDSLNFSEISEREKLSKKENREKNNPAFPIEKKIQEGMFSEKNLSVNEELLNHIEKYDKAFCILQSNFTSYREETEIKIQKLQEEVASVKNNLKSENSVKYKISNLIDSKISNTKSELKSQFELFLATFSECSPEKPPTRYSAIERIQRMREEHDSKLLENEKYLKSLQQSRESFRSNSRGCSDLVEENKKLREELSKLWNNS